MSKFFSPKGTQSKYKPNETRRDVRRWDQRLKLALTSEKGGEYILGGMVAFTGAMFLLPTGGEIALTVSLLMRQAYMRVDYRIYNFPWRIPKHAKLFDGSKNLELLNSLNNGDVRKYNPEVLYGEGVTYFGICRETGLPVYSTNSDDRTHLTCLGTTGSGKTEFLLAQVVNQLVQNSGLIYVDAKGDPALQANISRLARRFARDDDILTINFITSGRNLSRAQLDKVTNTFNMMSNTSDNMLIEFLINLLDDGGGGDGMWKGRAMTFIAAITRVLTYLRDNGFIQLSPSTYMQYMELTAIEELVFEHENKYGEFFTQVSGALKNYLNSLPGYNSSPKARKKQEQKTLEQHGFIVMQLTRAINELTYNYGYIFGAQQGDIDIFDCVLNRRILTIPLPALERSEGSLKMLGKLCIASIKQMMAGSLGNRIQGLVREILDSRATNSPNAFKLIFDEFGYIVTPGVSVMPAQGRSLSFSICFAAQDFSDIKRGNDNEAEAIWGNSNIKAIGRIVTGNNGDTMNKVNGVTGEEYQSRIASTELEVTDIGDKYTPSSNTNFNKESILPYDDLAGQENGEFTLLISKKIDGGVTAGVKIIRINSFYVAGQPLKYLRMNDLSPNFTISKERLPNPGKRIETVVNILRDSKRNLIGRSSKVDITPAFQAFGNMKDDPAYEIDPIARIKSFLITVLPQQMLDEQAFDTVGETQFGSDAVAEDHYSVLDQEQSNKALSIEIEAAVKEGIQFRPELADRIAEGAREIQKGVVATVDVRETLDTHNINPVNIFKLLKYAEECEIRLKRHNIDVVETKAHYSLLPFVPSHAEDAEYQEQYSETNKRMNSIAQEVAGIKSVSEQDMGLLSSIVDDFCGVISNVSQSGNNREKMLSLINQSKSQIRIN